MANQPRQLFSFKLPWFGPQTPTPQPTRPTTAPETRTPGPQFTAALAGFRAPGTQPTQPPPPAPTQPPPPPASAQTQTASKPVSPSRAPTESRVTSKPASPSRAPSASESRAASQPSSPSRAAPSSESHVTSQPPSPSRPRTQARAASLPPSPSRARASDSPSKSPAISKPPPPDSQTSPKPQPQSPSRLASQSAGRTTSSPASSPSRGASKLESTNGGVSETPSSQPANQDSSQSASFSPQTESPEPQREEKVAFSQPPPLHEPQPKMETNSEETPLAVNDSPVKTSSQDDRGARGAAQALSPVPQQEDKVALSQPPLQEPQPKMEITSEKTPNAQNDSPMKTISQADSGARDNAQASGPVTKAEPSSVEGAEAVGAAKKWDIRDNGGDQKTLSKLEGESNERQEEKKAVEEFPKEGKTKMSAFEEPIQKTITELVPTTVSGRGIHARDPPNVGFQKEKRSQKQGTLLDGDKTVASISYIGKQIKNSSSSGNTSDTSFQKPLSSTDEEAPRQKEIREDISKLVHKLKSAQQLVEQPVSVITLTGENRGANMHVSSEPANKEEPVHIHRGYKLNPDDSPENTTDGEADTEERKLKDHFSREAQPIMAYANSNVQSVNNSIVLNSAVTEGSPGIQLEFPQEAVEPIRSNGRSETHEARRAEFSMIPSEKLTHEPTVRRRCLRGLFLESSDSESDNPEKPRRHGCRYRCSENNRKDKEIGS
ncbi:hypothetical protein FNV43_RR11509 [Rhamnella rubrinervis]|uniref:Proteoglycan 4-like n=1 Tax=Rhamnella rubrinervis TaxID=2594499 RepID=A0A8K0MHX9_9ROSA|nr:hypothetical protein FNV43_RR11509 [Rhamnella rubrinervis]